MSAAVDIVNFADAQSNFAFNLSLCGGATASAITSPLSVSIVLAMVMLGAKNDTASQIRDTIAGNALSDAQVNERFSAALRTMNDSSALDVIIDIANRVYIDQGASLLQSYINAVQQYYFGSFRSLDFKNATGAAKVINTFVEDVTKDKIKNLVSADDVQNAELVLVNAIYFNASWDTPFSETNTQPASFYASPKKTVNVSMMSTSGQFYYHEDPTFQILGLPYRGHQVIMFVFLPKQTFGLTASLSSIDASILGTIIANNTQSPVNVQLPKFNAAFKQSLNKCLSNMGIVDAFQMNADFSGISSTSKLVVSDVVHQAFINVTEAGTEAAAATAAIMKVTSIMVPSGKPVSFVADHPFAFLIVSAQDLSILFSGFFTGN